MGKSTGAGVAKRKSAFSELGIKKTVNLLCEEVRELYVNDEVPWVVGYSGGKDSSATLQLVWLALRELPPEKLKKPIHIITTDTLVEQPVVAAWVDTSHRRIREAAKAEKLLFTPHKLVPEVQDTFWVNLIGRGYPAPRHKFRWCTSRMKINPSNRFILDVVRESGEAILVLGIRKAESSRRHAQMKKHEKYRVRDRLSPNASLPNSLVYSPIEDWTNDDVWMFLMQYKNPWGHDNKDLLGMYQGASADGECPLVVDETTPSCGNTRFGCWTCTLVDKDRSMEAMIKNDEEKVWMTPLMELRNELDKGDDRDRRDFRRLKGHVQLFKGRTIPGPYTKEWREHWLRRVLEAQQTVREVAPDSFKDLQLISMDQIKEIRRIWRVEKHEFDDRVPEIYEETVGDKFPLDEEDDALLSRHDWGLLQEICEEDQVFFELQASLLDTERQYRGMSRRVGIQEALLGCFRRSLYRNEEEATEVMTARAERKERAKNLDLFDEEPA